VAQVCVLRAPGQDLVANDDDGGREDALGHFWCAFRVRARSFSLPSFSVHAANSSVGPRHRSSSTSLKSFRSLTRVASFLNKRAFARFSPSTESGKDSIGPWRLMRRAAPWAPMPVIPG